MPTGIPNWFASEKLRLHRERLERLVEERVVKVVIDNPIDFFVEAGHNRIVRREGLRDVGRLKAETGRDAQFDHALKVVHMALEHSNVVGTHCVETEYDQLRLGDFLQVFQFVLQRFVDQIDLLKVIYLILFLLQFAFSALHLLFNFAVAFRLVQLELQIVLLLSLYLVLLNVLIAQQVHHGRRGAVRSSGRQGTIRVANRAR